MVSIHPVSDLASLLSLEPVKPDAYLGAGPVLGWGRIYGGQVVAQALRAAGLTVDERLCAQSLHAYFVQAGDEREPVLYEVERSVGCGFPGRWAMTRCCCCTSCGVAASPTVGDWPSPGCSTATVCTWPRSPRKRSPEIGAEPGGPSGA